MNAFHDLLVVEQPLINENVLLMLRAVNRQTSYMDGEIHLLPSEQKELYVEAQAHRLGIHRNQAEIMVDLAEEHAFQVIESERNGE